MGIFEMSLRIFWTFWRIECDRSARLDGLILLKVPRNAVDEHHFCVEDHVLPQEPNLPYPPLLISLSIPFPGTDTAA